jgi:ABC-2 type transport system ATP-binding protein
MRKQAKGNEILKIGVAGGDINDIFEKMMEIESVETVDFIDFECQILEVQSYAKMSSVKAIFDTCVANNYYLTELTPIETKLEDIFRELTTQ